MMSKSDVNTKGSTQKEKGEGWISVRPHVIYANTVDHKILQGNDHEYFPRQL